MPSSDTDTEHAQRNRETVERFCQVVFNEHQTAAAADFIRDDFIQHSPFLADGREPFIEYFSTLFAEYPRARMHVKRIVAEGDYVVVHSQFLLEPSDRGTALVDIFRLEDGRVAEHWDVIQEVPERAHNKNSMF
jgi:predicted SnoaL-like aldol condensation-catalyzing enzyme